MPTETEIAWAAGLFDGEGCVLARLYKVDGEVRGFHPWMQLQMKHEETVRKFREIVGFGSISHEKRKENLGKSDVFCVAIATRQALAAAKLLLPHSFTKRRSLELLIELQTHIIETPFKKGRGLRMPEDIFKHRESLYLEMKRLNFRGLTV